MAVAEKRDIAPHVLADPGGFDEMVFDAEKAAAGGADIGGGDGGEGPAVTVEGGGTVVDFRVLRDLLQFVHTATEHHIRVNDVAGLMVDELAGLFEAEHLADADRNGTAGANFRTGVGIHNRGRVFEPEEVERFEGLG